ncbi:hypothetical protein [Arthrobacter sp. NEB 688]|uniref:hypothetical protein n=1 Tax=Arthrobacter sp. NEB 688 TaxID=904039 RepID=UPI001563E50E|nr:hypothetical protein [Arthrobacter sp. NEB 688]QKE84105.1 hypothetical protein HL663_09245 [Arthrobacter sp. NEB 688]
MRAALVPLVLVMLPGALFVVGLALLRWFTGEPAPRALLSLARPTRWCAGRLAGVGEGMERVGLVRRTRPEPVPPVLLVLELRRLAAEVVRIEGDDQPHPAARLAAARAAYDHVLVQLCGQADVPTPSGLLPLDPRDRLGLEVELVAAGVDW